MSSFVSQLGCVTALHIPDTSAPRRAWVRVTAGVVQNLNDDGETPFT
jgi:hypothetical protein